mgnify:CR=1 FL=1
MFFTFKVNKQREEKVVFQLINLDTKTAVSIDDIKMYTNEGSSVVYLKKGIEGEDFATGVFSAENSVG